MSAKMKRTIATGTPSPLAGEGWGEGSVRRARALRKNATDVEKKLWCLLRSRQLNAFKFRRQHPIDHYIVDFVCMEKKLVIELDGGQHSIETDAKRTAYLESQGFKLLRFWNNEVIENSEGVLATILQVLDPPLTLTLSRKGRGNTASAAGKCPTLSVTTESAYGALGAVAPSPLAGEGWDEGDVRGNPSSDQPASPLEQTP